MAPHRFAFAYSCCRGYLARHKRAQIGMCGLKKQMKVIWHKDICDKFDTDSLTAIGQCNNKCVAITILDENILATVALVLHIVMSARIFYYSILTGRAISGYLHIYSIRQFQRADPLSLRNIP